MVVHWQGIVSLHQPFSAVVAPCLLHDPGHVCFLTLCQRCGFMSGQNLLHFLTYIIQAALPTPPHSIPGRSMCPKPGAPPVLSSTIVSCEPDPGRSREWGQHSITLPSLKKLTDSVSFLELRQAVEKAKDEC